MGKWNYDILFEGTEQECDENIGNFMHGVKEICIQRVREYAQAVIDDRPGDALRARAAVNEAVDCNNALVSDPRYGKLVESLKVKKAKEAEERLTKIVGEAIKRVVRE